MALHAVLEDEVLIRRNRARNRPYLPVGADEAGLIVDQRLSGVLAIDHKRRRGRVGLVQSEALLYYGLVLAGIREEDQGFVETASNPAPLER